MSQFIQMPSAAAHNVSIQQAASPAPVAASAENGAAGEDSAEIRKMMSYAALICDQSVPGSKLFY